MTSSATCPTITPAYDQDDPDTAAEYATETYRLFSGHQYVNAYEHYMRDPNGGANPNRVNTTLEEFCEAFFKTKDNLSWDNRFANTWGWCSASALPVSMINGFSLDDYEKLVSMVNVAGGSYKEGDPFLVSHEGYEFECVLTSDANDATEDNDDWQSYNVKLKATPFEWIITAQKLGYEANHLGIARWRYIKDGVFGEHEFRTPGEAAKAACIQAGAVIRNGDSVLPDKLITSLEEETGASLGF